MTPDRPDNDAPQVTITLGEHDARCLLDILTVHRKDIPFPHSVARAASEQIETQLFTQPPTPRRTP